MKRRRLLLILLTCVASITLAFLLWPREHEPEYNGVPLSEWLERFSRRQSQGFAEAIKHIGTNALPYLVRSVEYKPPRWKYWLAFKFSKLPQAISTSRFAEWLLDDKGIHRAEGAVAAFGILDRDALPALGELRRIASRNTSPYATYAVMTLTGSNPGDFPLF